LEESPFLPLTQTPSIYSEFGRSLEDIMLPPVEDPQLIRLKEFLDTEWGPPAVGMQLRALFAGGLPPIPPPQRWDTEIDVIQVIYEQLQSEKFVNEMWPSIKMLLKDDTCNTSWAAQTLTILALFNIIRILPIIGD